MTRPAAMAALILTAALWTLAVVCCPWAALDGTDNDTYTDALGGPL